MSSSFLNIINCNENDSVGELKDIIYHFERYMNKYIYHYYSKTEYRGSIKYIKYKFPDAYIKKFGGIKCANELFNYINSGINKRKIYDNKNRKFDIEYVAFRHDDNTLGHNFFSQNGFGYKYEANNLILPVIIPMKNLNELDTELCIKSQISTLEKEKINIQQELNKIKLDIQTEKDNYTNIIKDNNIKKDLQNKEIENLNIQFSKLKEENQKELITIKDTIDGIYRNEIYDNEYTFVESKYIIKEPMIHLDVDKILQDLKNSCCEIKNIYENYLKITCRKLGSNYEEIRLNFPIKFKLNNDEYIIKFYIINNNIIDKTCIKGYNYLPKSQYTIYITNYGRFIKSYEINFSPAIYKYGEHYSDKFEYTQINGNIIYNNSNTTITNNAGCETCYRSNGYYNKHGCGASEFMIVCENNKIELIQQPKLNYRIPRLFIDVIDAFHTQNTDLMQECCKKYLEISRESKIKDSILKDLELNNKLKEKDDIIKSKDLELEDKNKVIESQQEEINKLKDELTKFKQSLSMLINK